MEVESTTESTVSDSQATTATAEKKPGKASGNNRQGKKRPQFMLRMADIPEGKKTSSRAGIKRTVSLKSRSSQDLFFRTYSYLSDANYFLEIVAPGLAATHPDKPEHAELVRQFQELTRENMKNVRESLANQIQMAREAMENIGIDPDSNAMVFTEPLNEDAVITSHLDSEFLGILESVDTLVGLRGLGAIFSVFSAAEMGAMENSLRREVLSIYRTAMRNSRIAMQAAMGRYRPRQNPDAEASADAQASDAEDPTVEDLEPTASTDAAGKTGKTADVDGAHIGAG